MPDSNAAALIVCKACLRGMKDVPDLQERVARAKQVTSFDEETWGAALAAIQAEETEFLREPMRLASPSLPSSGLGANCADYVSFGAAANAYTYTQAERQLDMPQTPTGTQSSSDSSGPQFHSPTPSSDASLSLRSFEDSVNEFWNDGKMRQKFSRYKKAIFELGEAVQQRPVHHSIARNIDYELQKELRKRRSQFCPGSGDQISPYTTWQRRISPALLKVISYKNNEYSANFCGFIRGMRNIAIHVSDKYDHKEAKEFLKDWVRENFQDTNWDVDSYQTFTILYFLKATLGSRDILRTRNQQDDLEKVKDDLRHLSIDGTAGENTRLFNSLSKHVCALWERANAEIRKDNLRVKDGALIRFRLDLTGFQAGYRVGDSYLHRLIYDGQTELATGLIEQGYDLSWRNSMGEDALAYAVWNREYSEKEDLKESGRQIAETILAKKSQSTSSC